jgi:hypothetical protein
MNYAAGIVEMDSGATLYIPSFINTGSNIQKLMGGGIHIQTHKHRQQGGHVSLFLFSEKGK